RSSATTHHLREDSVYGVRMDERNFEPEQPASRPLVDQLGTLRGQLVDRAAHVVDLVGDVVHAGTALGEKLADGRVLAERGEQLAGLALVERLLLRQRQGDPVE